MTQIELPSDYQPVEQLIFCSNELIDVTVPVGLGSGAPLLIGRGEPISIWLCKSIGSPIGSLWETLIEDSKPVVDDVLLRTKEEGSGVVIVDDERMLQYANASENSVTVIKFDLRSFGVSIFGDTHGLRVGDNNLIGNHFKGLYSMIRIGL